MAKAIAKLKWSSATLALIGIAMSCTAQRRDDTTSVKQALTTSNGLAQNGLTTNGLVENGMWSNGMWSNGMWSNGMWSNGMWSNGMWSNGMWSNGMWSNGMWSNGMWSNGMWSNGLAGADAVPGTILRGSVYARQLLQYVYSCAMPATTYDTSLDPNDTAPLLCAADTDCDIGYECSPAGRCVIPLRGAGANGSGLGVNADGTTWWRDGRCDESCQRWVSACVLARTNAYGVRVPISIRAPLGAPQAVRDALEVSSDESRDYPLREGTFFGNIFATTPLDPPPAADYIGPATGAIVSTPVFYACAGPESNVPQVTKRFCSSQGDQSVINVPGICLTGTTQTGALEGGACAGEDAAHVMHDCYTTTSTTTRPSCAATDPSCYKQVLTVYLRTPIATCGNNVCEPPTEDATSCANDCHPGTWSETFDQSFVEQRSVNGSGPFVSTAVAPDGTIVLAGTASGAIDFGGGPLTGGSLGLVKLRADGTFDWGRRLSPTIPISRTESVAVAGDGSIVVAGRTGQNVWLGRFDATGNLAPGWPIALGGMGVTALHGATLAIDGSGNVVLNLNFEGTVTFATTPTPVSFTTTGDRGDMFIVKVSSAGAPQWAVALGPSESFFATPVAADSNGNVFVSKLRSGRVGSDPNSHLLKLSAADGAVAWEVLAYRNYCALLTDANGDLYVSTAGDTTIGGFVGKYAAGDGSNLWLEFQQIYHPSAVCSSGENFLGLGPDGTLVSSTVFGGFYETIADLGAGAFESYGTADVAIAGYATADTLAAGERRFRWAKHVPMVLSSRLDGMGVDATGHVVVSGVFSGSMQVDGQFLVNRLPELDSNANVFLASFPAPSTSDTVRPEIGAATDPTGAPLYTVPADIVVPATGPNGANVFFMSPTAVDSGHTGASVACSPAPNSLFRIGTTQVTCTASDPLGNTDVATFRVTVLDTLGPVFSHIGDIVVEAPDSNGAAVSFAPTASDQVDGNRAVTCIPASGTVFAVGDTTVTCSASDQSQHSSSANFRVTVTPPPIASPPPITAECVGALNAPVSVATSPGICGAVIDGASLAGACSEGGSPVACTFDGAPTETLAPGDHTVRVVATANNDAATCSSYLRVQDGERPVATCPDLRVECTGGGVATVTPTATCADNCGCLASCATGRFPVGASTGSCTATDPSGNSATCRPTITVVDTIAPATEAMAGPSSTCDRTIAIAITSYTITPKGGGTPVTGSASCWTSPGLAIALNASDTCASKQITYALAGAQTGGSTVSGNSVTVAVNAKGSTTLTYYATDMAGNQEVPKVLPMFVGRGVGGFGFSCAPSPSFKGLPRHGTIAAEGTVTITNPKTGKKTTLAFSFAHSY